VNAAQLVAKIQDDAPTEDNPLVLAVETGTIGLTLLGPLAAEQYRIVASDRRSFLLLAEKAAGTPAGVFFGTLAAGESLALDRLPALAAAGGLDAAGVTAYRPRPGCQAYPAYIAWLALNGEPAAVVLALQANFAAWGSYCARLAIALRRRYGLDDEACAFFDFFAMPAPDLDTQALAAVQAAMDAGTDLSAAGEYARLLQGYEGMFWSALA
jgi:hypothetical protein